METPTLSFPGNTRFRERLRALAERDAFVFPEAMIPPEFRRAAVLLPFWEEDGRIRVLLTQRAASLRAHKGEVAFPGGRLDPGESSQEAALREAHEEVGIDPSAVEIVGRVDDAWSGAGHHLVPWIGWIDEPPAWRANPDEVAALIPADAETLMRPGGVGIDTVEYEGVHYANATIALPGDVQAYGLMADLLLEVLEWTTGHRSERGAQRLRDLDTYVWKKR